MKFIYVPAVIAASGILIGAIAYATQVVAPHISAENCITHNAKQAGEAAPMIRYACEKKFSTEEELKMLPTSALSQITGKAQFLMGQFSATLYNGSGLYPIKKVTIGITDPETANDDHPLIRYYETNVDLQPLSTATVRFSVLEEYETAIWHIRDASW